MADIEKEAGISGIEHSIADLSSPTGPWGKVDGELPLPDSRLCGPGCMVAAAFIGPGTIVSCIKAGAGFGVNLLWVMTFAVIMAFVLQDMVGRTGLVTCHSLTDIFSRLQIPDALKTVLRLMICLGIGVAGTLFEGGNMAGAAVGMANLLGQPGWEAACTLVVGLLVIIIIKGGGIQVAQNLMAAVVGSLSIVFMMCAVLSRPSLSEVVTGFFRPRLPEGSITTAVSLIGTTIVCYNIFLQGNLEAKRSRAVRDQYRVEEATVWQQIRAMRLDTGSSMILGGVISSSVIVTAAGTFKDVEVPGTIPEMAVAMEPILGQIGVRIFYIGCLGAGLSSAITAPLAVQMTISDIFGWNDPVHATKSAAICFGIVVIGTAIPFTNAVLGVNATALITVAQVFNAMLLPLVASLLVYIAAQERFLLSFKSSVFLTILGTGSTIITFVLSGITMRNILFS